MGKMIINNRSSLPDQEALLYISSVIEQGRISDNNKQYCYVTVFHGDIYGEDMEIAVSSRKNKRSDRFVVTQRKVRN